MTSRSYAHRAEFPWTRTGCVEVRPILDIDEIRKTVVYSELQLDLSLHHHPPSAADRGTVSESGLSKTPASSYGLQRDRSDPHADAAGASPGSIAVVWWRFSGGDSTRPDRGMGVPHSRSTDWWFAAVIESAIQDIIFISVAPIPATLEQRLDRRVSLRELQRLRNIVHIIDMHH